MKLLFPGNGNLEWISNGETGWHDWFQFRKKDNKNTAKKIYIYNRYYIDRILHTDNRIPFSFYLWLCRYSVWG